jgi:excisionase family DNA binding protein
VSAVQDLLTTHQMEELLLVDRTTIYRMAKRGELPAMRVGNQWRFPREQVETWLEKRSRRGGPSPSRNGTEKRSSDRSAAGADGLTPAQMFPLECIQMIQDSYAELLGASVVVTDPAGEPLTRMSNPSGLVDAALATPEGTGYYADMWQGMGADPTLQARFVNDVLGLVWARGLVRDGKKVRALALVGGIAPEEWPPPPDRTQQAAYELGIGEKRLQPHLEEVHRLDSSGRKRVLPFVQRLGDILGHILEERMEIVDRMGRIAELTRLGAWQDRAGGK